MFGEVGRILPLEVLISLSRTAMTLLSLSSSGYLKVQSTSYSIINLHPSILKLWAVVSQWSCVRVATDLNKPHILGRNFSRYFNLSMLANKINNNFKVFWRIEFTRLTFKCLHSTVKFSREWGFINHHIGIVKSHVISNWKSIFTYLGFQASWFQQEPKSLVQYSENHPVTHVGHTSRIVFAIL